MLQLVLNHYTTPHHTTTTYHTTHHTQHTTPHHTRACTHTCNLVFLEVFIVVVAKELVELAQPNRDLLRAPLLHRKGEAFSGHLSTAADELLKGGRYVWTGRRCVKGREGGGWLDSMVQSRKVGGGWTKEEWK